MSSHRDYNKPACPGAAITEDFYVGAIQTAWQQLSGATTQSGTTTPPPQPVDVPVSDAPITTDSPLIAHTAAGHKEQVVAFVQGQLPADLEYSDSVAKIVNAYWAYAPTVGIDPFLAAAQWALETNSLRGPWAARAAGRLLRQSDVGNGLSFSAWTDTVQAHLGRLLAFALRDEELTSGATGADPPCAALSATGRRRPGRGPHAGRAVEPLDR